MKRERASCWRVRLRPSIINLGGEPVAGRAVREKGLRAAALPGRVAAADAVALDAGPRADERVGHIYQSVFGVALREQIFLRREYKLSHLCGRSLTRRRRAGDAKQFWDR